MKRSLSIVVGAPVLLLAVACGPTSRGRGTGGGGDGGPTTTETGDGGVFIPPDTDGGTWEAPDLLLHMCPTLAKADPKSFAAAFDLCGPEVVSVTFNSDANAQAHDIRTRLGLYAPVTGPTFAVMSTGIVSDEKDGFGVGAGVDVQPGTDFMEMHANPLPMQVMNSCTTSQDPTTVNDYVEYKVVLNVPANANSFSFDFNFMSAEYPEFVGSDYNDKFLVLLDSKSFKGNISFDKNKNPITINAGFFDVCQTAMVCNGSKTNTCTKPLAQLNGTGFEKIAPDFLTGTTEPMGGGTGWLHTTSPVTPGETATLRFIIFDESDGNYDSTVIIDNFQWGVDMSSGPTTIQ